VILKVHDHSVNTQRSLFIVFFANKICLDELQDQSKVNYEENVSTSIDYNY